MDDATAERLSANERRLREINERLSAGVGTVAGDSERIGFVCECSRTECRETVALTLVEYRRLRAGEQHFAVVPGHELEEIEHVIARQDGHLTVEKR